MYKNENLRRYQFKLKVYQEYTLSSCFLKSYEFRLDSTLPPSAVEKAFITHLPVWQT